MKIKGRRKVISEKHFFFVVRTFFREVRFTTKLRGEYKAFSYVPFLHHSKEWYIFPMMYLHWYKIIINQSPSCTLRITIGVKTFIGMDKCIMTYNHHHNIRKSILTVLKILCVLPSHSSCKTHLWYTLTFLLSP